jgi:mRNA interferase HigB
MRIFSLRTVRDFWNKHPDAEIPLRTWYKDTLKSKWNNPMDVKQYRRDVSIIANNRVVFNIKGNNYRLIVEIEYSSEVVFVQFVGTHKEYDRVDAATIQQY